MNDQQSNASAHIRVRVWIMLIGVAVLLTVGLGWLLQEKKPNSKKLEAGDSVAAEPKTTTTNNAPSTLEAPPSPEKPGYLRYLLMHDHKAYYAYLDVLELQKQGPVDFYAQLVDQDNQPVADAKFDFSLAFYDPKNLKTTNSQGDVEALRQQTNFSLMSDARGRVDLTGMEGLQLHLQHIGKPGYLIDESLFQLFTYGKDRDRNIPTYWHQNSPLIFKAWKTVGHPVALMPVNVIVKYRPMTNGETFVRWYVNLLSGKVSDQMFEGSDLTVTVNHIQPGNGQADYGLIEVRVLQGSILKTDHVRPFLAPPNLADSVWTLRTDGDYLKNLRSVQVQNVYARLRSGQLWFGGEIDTSNWRAMVIGGYVNPDGSRNLEPDPEKLIADPEAIHRLDEQTRIR